MASFYDNLYSHLIKTYPFATKIIQDIKPDFIIQCCTISTPLGKVFEISLLLLGQFYYLAELPFDFAFRPTRWSLFSISVLCLGIDQKIPYALLFTSSPTFFGGEDLPPPMSDLHSEPTRENKKLWSDFFDQAHLLRHCDLRVRLHII